MADEDNEQPPATEQRKMITLKVRIDDEMTVNLTIPEVIDASEIYGHFMRIQQLSKSVIGVQPVENKRTVIWLTTNQLKEIKEYVDQHPEQSPTKQSQVLSEQLGAKESTIYVRIKTGNFGIGSKEKIFYTKEDDDKIIQLYDTAISDYNNGLKISEHFGNRSPNSIISRIQRLKHKGRIGGN